MDTINELEQAEAEYRFAKLQYNETLYKNPGCTRNPENILDTDDIECVWIP